MLSQTQRSTILELHTQGVSLREIARLLSLSRPAVRKVLRSKATQVPELHRSEKATPHRARIRADLVLSAAWHRAVTHRTGRPL